MKRITVCAFAAILVAVAAGFADAVPPRNGRIVFQRFDPQLEKMRLYTVESDGSALRAITKPGANEDKDSQADWSPDGRRIVFRRFVNFGEPNERADLLVVNADGSGLKNLTAASCRVPCLANEEPAWSPDGKRIAFTRTIGPPPSNGGPPPMVGIFVMNADGSSVRQLTQRKPNAGTEDHTPNWSPDGKRIAFMRVNNTNRPVSASVLWVMNADGTLAKVLRNLSHKWPGGGVPAWSPDGKRILYTTYCWFGGCGQPATGAQLFTIEANGSGVRQLTRVKGNAVTGAWSPDGKKIVFAQNPRVGPEGDIYTMNTNGTGLVRVTRSPELAAQDPDWGPR